MRSINKNHEFAKMWGAARNLNFAEVSYPEFRYKFIHFTRRFQIISGSIIIKFAPPA